MICAIYKSLKHEEMYLYIAKRDDFSAVPPPLLHHFGKAQLVMLFDLNGNKPLHRANTKAVQHAIETQGFYLQMPPPVENLHTTFVQQQKQLKENR